MTRGRGPGDTGPGILETSIVLGASLLLAAVIVVFFSSQLAQAVGVLVDLSQGGH